MQSVNTCPVDRIRFNTLEVFDSVDGKCVEKVRTARGYPDRESMLVFITIICT